MSPSSSRRGSTTRRQAGRAGVRAPGPASAPDPVTALRQIAFLLEAEGTAHYKAEAFERAARTVEALAPDELVRLDRLRRLEQLEHIGKATAGVIHEALAGERPGYLAELEQRAPSLPSGRASALLRRLKGDGHSHSDWSDGGASIEEMARAAKALGRSYQALTDHSPRLAIAHGLSADALRRQMAIVAELNEELAPFRLLTGIEVDILDDGALDQEERLLAELDVVVGSVHSTLKMEPEQMTRRMVTAVANPHVDILGHCTGRIVAGKGRPPSRFDHEAVFAACAAHDTAVEINARPDPRDPPLELLAAAKAAGCRFAIDSDAHAPGQLAWLGLGCEQAAEAGIGATSVVNAMTLERFLAWTASHA